MSNMWQRTSNVHQTFLQVWKHEWRQDRWSTGNLADRYSLNMMGLTLEDPSASGGSIMYLHYSSLTKNSQRFCLLGGVTYFVLKIEGGVTNFVPGIRGGGAQILYPGIFGNPPAPPGYK